MAPCVFQDRCLKPLGHPSVSGRSGTYPRRTPNAMRLRSGLASILAFGRPHCWCLRCFFGSGKGLGDGAGDVAPVSVNGWYVCVSQFSAKTE
jgi:hypothetical protein